MKLTEDALRDYDVRLPWLDGNNNYY